jgi:hypothetical protein
MYTTISGVAAKLHGNGYIAKQSVALKAVTLDFEAFEAAWPISASTGAVHRSWYRVALLGSKRILLHIRPRLAGRFACGLGDCDSREGRSFASIIIEHLHLYFFTRLRASPRTLSI